MDFDQDIYFKILNSAIQLDIEKGHLKWSITELAKTSDMSRSLIYYYFPDGKSEIIKESVVKYGEYIIGVSEERLDMMKNGRFLDSFLTAKNFIDQLPHFGEFYFIHKDSKSEVGKTLEELEVKFFKKIESLFSGLEKDRVVLLKAVVKGLLFEKNISLEFLKKHYEPLIFYIVSGQKSDS